MRPNRRNSDVRGESFDERDGESGDSVILRQSEVKLVIKLKNLGVTVYKMLSIAYAENKYAQFLYGLLTSNVFWVLFIPPKTQSTQVGPVACGSLSFSAHALSV